MKLVNEASPVVYNSNDSMNVYRARHLITCYRTVCNCELSSLGKVFCLEIPVNCCYLLEEFPYNFGWLKQGRNSGNYGAFLAKMKNLFPLNTWVYIKKKTVLWAVKFLRQRTEARMTESQWEVWVISRTWGSWKAHYEGYWVSPAPEQRQHHAWWRSSCYSKLLPRLF